MTFSTFIFSSRWYSWQSLEYFWRVLNKILKCIFFTKTTFKWGSSQALQVAAIEKLMRTSRLSWEVDEERRHQTENCPVQCEEAESEVLDPPILRTLSVLSDTVISTVRLWSGSHADHQHHTTYQHQELEVKKKRGCETHMIYDIFHHLFHLEDFWKCLLLLSYHVFIMHRI